MDITFSKNASGAPHVYMRDLEAEENRDFVTYADADLAGDVDNRKSTTGVAIVLNGGLVSWTSKLQSTIALSTAEAETNAATDAVKQVMHLR